MNKLSEDTTRRKILLRIENETYDYCYRKAVKEDKSITLVINELLDSAINRTNLSDTAFLTNFINLNEKRL